MLKDIKSFPAIESFGFYLSMWDAYDPDSKAHLVSSNGRRSSGRARKYWVIIPTGRWYRYTHPNSLTTKREFADVESKEYPYDEFYRYGFTAWTLAEAIEKANHKLPKTLDKIRTHLATSPLEDFK